MLLHDWTQSRCFCTAPSREALSPMHIFECLCRAEPSLLCLHMQPSVDGKEPVDEALYRQVWGLQSAFQDPIKQIDPEHWAKTVSSIQSVLSKLQLEPVGVASTTTAVSQGTACHLCRPACIAHMEVTVVQCYIHSFLSSHLLHRGQCWFTSSKQQQAFWPC